MRAPEVMAMAAKMTVGMAGWMSARAATVVDRVPPTLETREEEPTPAALTVVGINSPGRNITFHVFSQLITDFKLDIIIKQYPPLSGSVNDPDFIRSFAKLYSII